MKTNKLRVFDKQSGKFAEHNRHYDFFVGLDGSLYGYNGMEMHKISETDAVFAGESTGLKDRNAKEIYVGDIISFVDSTKEFPIEQIIWYEDTYVGIALYKTSGDQGAHWNFANWASQCYVVGNIHENPDLLKT